MVHWIDTYIEHLQGWKETIASGDAEQLEAAFEEVTRARLQWLQQRRSQHWEDVSTPGIPKPPGFFRSMFGFGGRATG
jgi:hypothetical protein